MAEPLTWPAATPESVGLSTARLEAMWDVLCQRGTKTLVVARRGELVFEGYADGFDAARPHHTASLAKTLVGGMSLALAIDDGLLEADDLVSKFVPSWAQDSLKATVTIRHLATHTSGVEDAEPSDADRAQAEREGAALIDDHMELPGWKGAFWRGTNTAHSRDEDISPFLAARDQAPIMFSPGSQYAYSNPGMAMLSWCVTVALQRAGLPDIRTYLADRLFEPLGLRQDVDCSIGYSRIYEVEGLPLVANWGGGSFTARAAARVGQLLVQDGVWEDRQLISPAVLRQSLEFAGMPIPEQERKEDPSAPGSGLGFWTNADGAWAGVPRDAVAGAGAGNQVLFAIPSLELVVVRNGSVLEADADRMFWGGLVEHLFTPVVAACRLRSQQPASERITGVTWDPPGQTRRLAMGGRRKDGSDNWPLAWADDGHLYTAYGDGYGFEPQLDHKLSMGFGVVTGGASDFVARNVRSDGERLGSGRQGEKSSGLLCIDGVIYIFVRNADHDGHTSRLGWSTDHMKSWSWADWSFAELGHVSFIDFGRDYADARDDFVYVTSHDDPSAYVQADHYVLGRVPKEKLADPGAYEFFVEVNDRGEPVWSPSIEDRGPVFSHEGQCRRSSISYHPQLGRYMLWQQLTGEDDTDTRFEGGFGLYDAPEPWGPWTTVFFTDQWDIGPGDLGHLPPKWSSEDGREVWMVFSGSDNFCVRRAVLELSGDG
ncbi:MAG: serine hydrolase [Gemmatimonadetes bacterium]|jgi:CubicO group peptidase (beta-lactamase class C family)|nr:serine hydrolase [Gemmatimonadota bacterium]MBT5060162.1 serine hydrolase [Gemmatimonadota bacterium]MBT5146493.1 serine hydrolase [Gemmatimonadota bacterium]MBT5591414.1 serine hydrolase [Gemmatimonadota bacterium]MBT5962131.1 serine hydrolase [Gemmatimonadota bacterium]